MSINLTKDETYEIKGSLRDIGLIIKFAIIGINKNPVQSPEFHDLRKKLIDIVLCPEGLNEKIEYTSEMGEY